MKKKFILLILTFCFSNYSMERKLILNTTQENYWNITALKKSVVFEMQANENSVSFLPIPNKLQSLEKSCESLKMKIQIKKGMKIFFNGVSYLNFAGLLNCWVNTTRNFFWSDSEIDAFSTGSTFVLSTASFVYIIKQCDKIQQNLTANIEDHEQELKELFSGKDLIIQKLNGLPTNKIYDV